MKARTWAKITAWTMERERRAVLREHPAAKVWWTDQDGNYFTDESATREALTLARYMRSKAAS